MSSSRSAKHSILALLLAVATIAPIGTSYTATAASTYDISGQVTNSDGSFPNGNTTIMLTSTTDSSNSVTSSVDSNGNYLLSVYPGTYNVSILRIYTSGNYYAEIQTFAAVDTIIVTNANISNNYELPLFATITLHVTSADGSPEVNSIANYQGATSPHPIASTDNPDGYIVTDSAASQTDASGNASFPVVIDQVIPANNFEASEIVTSTQIVDPNGLNVTGNTIVQLPAEPHPSSPMNFNATVGSDGYPLLTWSGVSNAQGYVIYRNGQQIVGIGGSATSYEDQSGLNPGNYSYYMYAYNGNGASLASQTSSVTITPSTAPSITSPTTFTTNARAVTSFTVTTSGYPTPALSESGNLPTGLAFTNNGNGTATISGQASPVNNGIYALTFTATNTAGSVSQSFYLSVNNAETIPTFINASSVTENYGVPFSFAVDTTGNPIPNIKRGTGGNSFPPGVSIKDNNDGTATLTGTGNTKLAKGTYTFTFQAKNKNGTGTQSFTLTIN